MTYEKLMIELFGFSSPTYYKWSKHDKRKIFDLLSYAFSNSELEEFLNSGKITKIEGDFAVVELNRGVEVKVQRASVISVLPEGTLNNL